MYEIDDVLRQIVQQTIKGLKLTEISTGVVDSASPLRIKTDETMISIPEAAIFVPEGMRQKTVPVQGGAGGTVEVQKGLAAGDAVVMLRVRHGQQYIVLSRI